MGRCTWAVALALGLVGVAGGAEYLQDFDGAPYASLPDGTNINGTDGWEQQGARNRIVTSNATDWPGNGTRFVQLYQGTGSPSMIRRAMLPQEQDFYTNYQFTAWVNPGTAHRTDVTFTFTGGGLADLAVSGSRLGFGIVDGKLVVYPDQQPEYVSSAGLLQLGSDPNWYDIMVSLNPIADSVSLSYRETGTTTWSSLGPVASFPAGWGGELIQPGAILLMGSPADDGGGVDNITMFIPEPGTAALLGVGVLLALRRRWA